MNDLINLVDSSGKRIGGIEKLKAHQEGKLHEAFSVFVFDTKGELLLQRRAEGKYHSGGLWTNTCCSHAFMGELLEGAVHRRLQEEMGFDCELRELSPVPYRAELANGLIENEYDHIFVGTSDATPTIDPAEASDFKRMKAGDLIVDIAAHPERYTEWLKIILKDTSFLSHVL